MTEVKAQLNSYRGSPRKVRLVADLVRGKSLAAAATALKFAPKRAALPIQKLFASAAANAKNLNVPRENLFVKKITVDGGAILYRRRPMSRGRAFVIRKRTSHISLVLAEKSDFKKVIKAKNSKLKS